MNLVVIPIMIFAAFIQSMIGFGSGLIAMPLLIATIGLSAASPAFAIAGQILSIALIWRYRQAWRWRDIWRVSSAGLLMIPVGVWGAQQVDENIVMLSLGIVTAGYALYTLLGLKLPELAPNSGFGFGIIAGLLHGAYNTGGPPLVMYGSSQRWQPEKFKGNMQVLFFLNGLLLIATHFASGHITDTVLSYVLLMFPSMLIGMFLGVSFDGRVQPQTFHRGVLVLLLLLGVSMIV